MPSAQHAGSLTPQEARAIAKEAFVYGFPMVENYKCIYFYAVAEGTPAYKAPFNTLYNTANVYTPADTTVVTPNSDTPYSYVVFDLRTEPMVLTVAPVEEGRYFSFQTFDLYTYLAPYLGTRTTGNQGGTYLFAGPSWTGPAPEGVDLVLQLPTDLGITLARTQLFSPDDLPNVLKVQAGYRAEPLSRWLGRPAPPPAPAVDWMPYDDAKADGIGFFDYLAFLLPFAPALPEDVPTRDRIARLGIEPGKPFSVDALPADIKAALAAGIADANAEINAAITVLPNADNLFGSREFLTGRDFDRAVGARWGIYGNAKEEAKYVSYKVDADGQPLNGVAHRYTLTFAADALPPVDAFWSLTAYDGKTQLLIDNPINRYLINKPMLPNLARDADGGLTLLLQRDSPGPGRETNWLPVPDGPFYCVLRLYLPQEAALTGAWAAPKMARAD